MGWRQQVHGGSLVGRSARHGSALKGRACLVRPQLQGPGWSKGRDSAASCRRVTATPVRLAVYRCRASAAQADAAARESWHGAAAGPSILLRASLAQGGVGVSVVHLRGGGMRQSDDASEGEQGWPRAWKALPQSSTKTPTAGGRAARPDVSPALCLTRFPYTTTPPHPLSTGIAQTSRPTASHAHPPTRPPTHPAVVQRVGEGAGQGVAHAAAWRQVHVHVVVLLQASAGGGGVHARVTVACAAPPARAPSAALSSQGAPHLPLLRPTGRLRDPCSAHLFLLRPLGLLLFHCLLVKLSLGSLRRSVTRAPSGDETAQTRGPQSSGASAVGRLHGAPTASRCAQRRSSHPEQPNLTAYPAHASPRLPPSACNAPRR